MDLPHTLHRQQPAMATQFEVILAGEDSEHLESVASACFDEFTRIEGLLSRFDPASEIARINREAAQRPVRLDVEVLNVLAHCLAWSEETGGAFHPFARSGQAQSAAGDAIDFDAASRTIRFRRGDVQIDLGAYGKGYALDRGADIVRQFAVPSALLNAGTSSLRMIGRTAEGEAWPVGLRDPWQPDREFLQLRLADAGFSCSATFGRRQEVSDILDPRTGEPLAEQAACAVIAPDAATAEVLSTALLVMGRARATTYIGERALAGVGAGWIARADDRTCWEWLTEPVCPIRRLDEPS